jgi:uncharacterized integral membrane protein
MRRREEDPFDDRDDRRADGDAADVGRPPAGNARWIVVALVAIVLVAFAIANFRPVRVNFLLFTTRARVVTVVVVAGLLGFVVGYFVGRPGREERKRLREWRPPREKD